VLFSSHQLDLVERLCEDLVIIANGRIRGTGTAESLRSLNSSPSWELTTDGDAGWLREVAGVTVVEFAGGWARFEADDVVAQLVLHSAVERGSVASFRPHRPPLSQIFTEVVK